MIAGLIENDGQTFGHGMRVAPNAVYNDGLFDIVLVEGMPRTRIVMALNTVFSGKHLLRSDVHSSRARVAEITSPDGLIGLELDGENTSGQQLKFEVLPEALNALANTSAT